MFDSSDYVKTPSSGNTRSSNETATAKKKSILVSPEYKRGSSKATIQWEESVKGQRLEERMKLEKRNRLHALGQLMAHGSKWSYIQEFMTKLKVTDDGKLFKNNRISEEDFPGRASSKRIDSLVLVRELWHGMLQKIVMKGGDLTLDQQTELELLKHRIKLENDKYLKGHPELDILLSLVYRKLLRTKPDDPKVFVANYVHYLNIHREELVLDEVDVPFDQAPVKTEEPGEHLVNERQEVEMFARGLVQKCFEMASCGSAVANVTKIIDSMLENIDEGESSSLKSAENAVKGILMSMLTSVAQARTKSAEIVVEEILDSVFDGVCPMVRRDSETFFEMKESVESFVRSLLKTVTDKVARQVRRQDRLNRFERSISREQLSEQDAISITSKSILKKLLPSNLGGENSSLKPIDKPELKSKVKFQSVSLAGSPSKEFDLNLMESSN